MVSAHRVVSRVFGLNRERAPETEKEREVLLSTLKRVVIGIDPSGCAGENDKRSDEVGIVVAGVGHDGIARILEDATGRYSPDQWANKVRRGAHSVVNQKCTDMRRY